MLLRALTVLALLALVLLGVAVVRDPPLARPPPAITLPPPAEGEPELAPPGAPVPLAGAGVRFELPTGFVVRPGSLTGGRGHSTARAEGHGVLASAAFYSRDAEALRKAYAELATREASPEEALLFLGGRDVLSRQTKALPGGTLAIFELQPTDRARRETFLVATPAKGSGLATLSLNFRFVPATARMILRLIEKVRFEGPR